jgi:hypothetical protein
MPRKPKEIKMCSTHKDKSIVLYSGASCPLCAFYVTLGDLYHEKTIEKEEKENG